MKLSRLSHAGDLPPPREALWFNPRDGGSLQLGSTRRSAGAERFCWATRLAIQVTTGWLLSDLGSQSGLTSHDYRTPSHALRLDLLHQFFVQRSMSCLAIS